METRKGDNDYEKDAFSGSGPGSDDEPGKRYSQTDPHRHTDFVKLAEGFGLKGYRCQNLAEFQSAFAEAMKRKGPTWIECIIDKDEKVLPMIPGGGDINDIIMK